MRGNLRKYAAFVLLFAAIAALLSDNGRLRKRVAAKAQTIRDLQQALSDLTATLLRMKAGHGSTRDAQPGETRLQ